MKRREKMLVVEICSLYIKRKKKEIVILRVLRDS